MKNTAYKNLKLTHELTLDSGKLCHFMSNTGIFGVSPKTATNTKKAAFPREKRLILLGF